MGLFIVAPRTVEARLRVVSFNVWGVPVVSPERPERITEIGHQVAALQPDFVAFQEVWEADDAARLAPALAAAGLTAQMHFGPSEDGRGSGLWIASRHPILRTRFVPFATGGKPYIHWHLDYLSNKGVAIIEIDTPDGAVSIANTHFQSSYTFGDYTFIQLAQALTVADAVETVKTPLVFVGDINVMPDSVVSQTLIARARLTPAADSFGLDVTMARSSANAELRNVGFQHKFEDRILFRSGRNRTLSDHPCLVTDYEIVPCTTCAPAPSWAATRSAYAAFIEDNETYTQRVALLCKLLAVVLLAAAGFTVRTGVRRRLTGVRRVATGALFVFEVLLFGWLVYVSFAYTPYKLDVLEELEARSEPSALVE